MTNANTHNKRKVRLILVALFATIAIITGSIFAFFSDVVTHNTAITAGTLDLVKGTPKVTQNGVVDGDGTIENFNPGDVVTFEVPVTNSGNKSAWVRANFVLAGDAVAAGSEGTDVTDFEDIFEVFEGPVAQANAGTATNLADGANWTFDASNATFTDPNPAILNGTGADAETETSDGGVDSVTKTYTIYFKPEAKNKWQGKDISIDYRVEGMQYRNNPTPTWTGLEVKN